MRASLSICALVAAASFACWSPAAAGEAGDFRLADWEIEAQRLGRTPGAPPPDDIARAAATPAAAEADAAETADASLDAPSMIETGAPDPAFTVERVAAALRRVFGAAGDDQARRQELAAFYAARRFEPLFVHQGVLSERGRIALARLGEAGDDGLDPIAYRALSPEGPRTAESVARLELQIASAVARYASDASGGRIATPQRVSANFDVEPPRIAPGEALAAVASAADVRAALDGFNPPHEGFRRLRAKLVELRSERREMRAGETARVRAQTERDVVANLERWRWLPRDLGSTHIWVNIPEYDVEVVRDGAVIHRTRSIVGRTETPTPIFSDAMNHIVFNPFWHVPLSIVRREMLGPASRDGGYFARRGIEVVQRGRVIDPASVNWSNAQIGRYAFRQPPGERNALGRMKFMFPNHHAVYLHDTPSRALFSREERAFSSGCIRVQNPEDLAAVLLSLAMEGETWSATRVRSLYGERERTVRFRRPLPIHLVYFTVTVDENGGLVHHDDIYGDHVRVRAALSGARG